MQGQTGIYKMFLTGGPAIAGGYNVASRFGILAAVDSLSKWDYRAPNELTQAFPLPFLNPSDTVYWEFAYNAPGNPCIDTIYSCGISTNWDSIPNNLDLWAYGPKYPVTVIAEVPVELIQFQAERSGGKVNLTWSTATELNNSGFAVERSVNKKDWRQVAFIKGEGNSTRNKEYKYIDEVTGQADYYYRLKQIDFNGSFIYSSVISAGSDNFQGGYALLQNFPNPFNPSTKIKYNIPEGADGLTTLKIYDLLGKEIEVLVNKEQSAGSYEVEFNGRDLPSGVYIYTMSNGSFSSSRKFILMK